MLFRLSSDNFFAYFPLVAVELYFLQVGNRFLRDILGGWQGYGLRGNGWMDGIAQ